MRILNYINKALTGYRSKSQIINGIRVDYQFAGKPVLFDPLMMLQELGFQYQKAENLPVSADLKNTLPALKFLCVDDLSPSVISTMKTPHGKFHVNRFVKKSGDKSCSSYQFFLDQKLFAQFTRIYDYGETFHSILSTQKNIEQLVEDKSSQIICCDLEGCEKFLIDNFGHSHFWHIRDYSVIERLLALKNSLS